MGMFTDCQDEIIRALKIAGCERDPFTSKKRMLASSESRISAVLCEEETVERDSGKKIYTDSAGGKKKRNKLYNRDITYTVVIGDYSQVSAERTYEAFLLQLASGIYVDGNYVSIDPSDGQWYGEKDHILYAKVAVQVKITCHGGLYQDTNMLQLKETEIGVKKGE